MWKVFFEGNFWGHSGRDHAGKEIAVGKSFLWGGRRWLVPSVYVCGRGLVMDFCMEAPAQEIRDFMDKWNLSLENRRGEGFTREQRREMERENPLYADLSPEAAVNGKALLASHGCGLCWNPCIPSEYDQRPEVQAVMEHYGLDPARGWSIYRQSFAWPTRKKPELRSLELTMSRRELAVPGDCFSVKAAGEAVSFLHPVTGRKHTLTVGEYEPQKLPANSLAHRPELEYPSYFTVMTYSLRTDLPDGKFMVQDCADSDQPKKKERAPLEPESREDASCIGIIGGADGPTAILLGQENQDRLYAACSALHFEPAEEIQWRMVFYEKQVEDLTLNLI